MGASPAPLRWCVLPALALASCSSSAPSAESPPADTCTLDAHTCVASPAGTYCWYLVGASVDEARHCQARHAIERCEPGRGAGDGALGCYHIRQDGGVAETVITPDHWPDVRHEPGFTPCTTDEYVAAVSLPPCT